MPLIQWKDELSVKVTGIDQQHQKWIGMMNDLHEAMKTGRGNKIIKGVLDGLIAYTREHFSFEEKYFVEFKYPDKDKHMAMHQEFVKKITEFETKYKQGSLTLTIDVLNFLSDWLLNHIKVVDQKYSKHFVEHGLR